MKVLRSMNSSRFTFLFIVALVVADYWVRAAVDFHHGGSGFHMVAATLFCLYLPAEAWRYSRPRHAPTEVEQEKPQ